MSDGGGFLMDFEDARLCAGGARAWGDRRWIVELLTREPRPVSSPTSPAASRRMKPAMQVPGARVIAFAIAFGATAHEQLGSAQVEAMGEGPAALFDQPLALAGLAAAAAVAAGGLPEREPHAGAFDAFDALAATLSDAEIWPAVYVRFEAGLLQAL